MTNDTPKTPIILSENFRSRLLSKIDLVVLLLVFSSDVLTLCILIDLCSRGSRRTMLA